MLSVLSSLLHNILEDPLILRIGAGCLLAQTVLTVAFKFAPLEGPWKHTALFSAKQSITIALMVYQTVWGFVYWNKEGQEGVHDLVIDDQMEEGGIFLSRVVLGGLLQDIPVGLLTGSVDTVMHLHHLGMFTVASISLGYFTSGSMSVGVGTVYAPFFFGVIELSSIPLTLVDMFHPHKQPEWFQFHNQHPMLQKLNEVSRVVFAGLYLLMRMIYFPRIVTRQVVPDMWNKLQHSANNPYKTPIAMILVFSILFTFLQLYWGTLIIRQVAKALKGDGDEKETKRNQIKAKIKAV